MSGLADKMSGKAKQVAGVLKDDKRLEGEGKSDEARGDMKQKATGVLDDVGRKVDDLKTKVNEK